MDSDPHGIASAMRSMEAAFLLGVPGATEVWLVRHGATAPTEDPPLSDQGREQARRLAARVNRVGYDAVYASPLRRAQETARTITPDIRLDERLVEVAVELDDGHVEFVEEPGRVLERMRSAVADAVAACPGGRVLMVGHGVSILHYLCDVLRLEVGTLRLLPYYTSVNVVRVLGDRRMVGSLADVAHLEA